MFKWIVNLFKSNNKEIYQCLVLKQDIITITLKSLREFSIKEYNIDPFEKSQTICELSFDKLPLNKMEKKILLKGKVIHFNNISLTSYKELYEKIRKLSNGL
jgi:hypothetical protein